MAGETTGEVATLPEDRDVAVRELWRRVFAPGPSIASPPLNHVETRLDRVDDRLSQVEVRLDRVDDRLGQVETRLDRVDDRLNRLDDRLGHVETRLAVVETKMSTLETAAIRLDAAVVRLQDNSRTDFRLTFGAIIATALGLPGMMAKGFHWF